MIIIINIWITIQHLQFNADKNILGLLYILHCVSITQLMMFCQIMQMNTLLLFAFFHFLDSSCVILFHVVFMWSSCTPLLDVTLTSLTWCVEMHHLHLSSLCLCRCNNNYVFLHCLESLFLCDLHSLPESRRGRSCYLHLMTSCQCFTLIIPGLFSFNVLWGLPPGITMSGFSSKIALFSGDCYSVDWCAGLCNGVELQVFHQVGWACFLY